MFVLAIFDSFIILLQFSSIGNMTGIPHFNQKKPDPACSLSGQLTVR
jgi:hypothetical protein